MNFFKRLLDRSPKIETKRLLLRHLRVSDARDMYEYARLDKVTRYLLWAPHQDIDYTRSYLCQVEKAYRQGSFFDFAVVYKENNKMIGTCGFARVDKANATAEAGYVLNPEYWGRGIACEALSAVIAMGFQHCGYNRIESRYMVDNIASRRVMEKCGMKFEGVLRQSVFGMERYEDVGICSVLRDEYAPKGDEVQKFTNI